MPDYNWNNLPTRALVMDGQEITLRPLKKSDEAALGDYFLGLSAQTRRVYAPHPFDRATASSICAGLGTATGDSYVRLLALTGSTVIAYFILHLGLHEKDRERRYRHLDPDLACMLAPSVTDAWQDRGLGSHLMAYAKDCARVFGRKVMVLWGGVREENPRAIHFYTKSGFRKLGEFVSTETNTGTPEQINNIDMAVDL